MSLASVAKNTGALELGVPDTVVIVLIRLVFWIALADYRDTQVLEPRVVFLVGAGGSAVSIPLPSLRASAATIEPTTTCRNSR